MVKFIFKLSIKLVDLPQKSRKQAKPSSCSQPWSRYFFWTLHYKQHMNTSYLFASKLLLTFCDNFCAQHKNEQVLKMIMTFEVARPVDTGGGAGGAMPPNNSPNLSLEML